MLGCLETLRDDLRLRSLLGEYRSRHQANPDAEWLDRVLELPKIDVERLGRLHGYALASGWIDTRVDRASFSTLGGVTAGYRLTREGAHALNSIEIDGDEDSNFDDDSLLPAR